MEASDIRQVYDFERDGEAAATPIAYLDLYFIHPFFVSRPKVIALFIQNPSIAEVVKARLTLQTLISNTGLDMSSIEARLLFRMPFQIQLRLPLRHAIRSQLQPSHPRYEAYLIAISISRAPWYFKDAGITRQDVQDVLRALRGSSPIIYGNTWVTLDIVKLHYATPMVSGDTTQLLDIAKVFEANVELVHNTYGHLLYAFQEHGLWPDPLPVETAVEHCADWGTRSFRVDVSWPVSPEADEDAIEERQESTDCYLEDADEFAEWNIQRG
ncbi:uncharacterized protein FIESC28_02107 [Fusarium coffeatum]|uniref:Uncharacterized protein n=1 Tax=Fusarium coffeatum TaxID=231269 RepID=A0A366S7D1_9HYPO|nr:uncharacterized protein FIESC28_02107 [Fusarium coffeatum]RBR25199.1 hypothetical protein FIESC28_02107 [Fusarium coffeatum]